MKPTTGQTVGLVTGTDRNTRPPRITGMPKKMSASRESRASRQPPKNPARAAQHAPSSAAPMVAQTPTVIEARAP